MGTDYPADTTLPKGDDFYTMNTAKIKFTFLDQQEPTSAVRLCADTETGSANVKNPVHGKPLTEDQKSVAATFLLEDVTSFEFQPHSSCCSNNGRNFFFEGQTTMTPPPCKKIE